MESVFASVNFSVLFSFTLCENLHYFSSEKQGGDSIMWGIFFVWFDFMP